jgi:hypothetical protein
MAEPMLPSLRMFRQYWSHTLKGMMLSQLWILKTGFKAAQTVLRPVSMEPVGAIGPVVGRGTPGASKTQDIIRRATERMSQGLAPPREVYLAPYRNQIDWSRFPDWARPSDPEMFEGSGHEG